MMLDDVSYRVTEIGVGDVHSGHGIVVKFPEETGWRRTPYRKPNIDKRAPLFPEQNGHWWPLWLAWEEGTDFLNEVLVIVHRWPRFLLHLPSAFARASP